MSTATLTSVRPATAARPVGAARVQTRTSPARTSPERTSRVRSGRATDRRTALVLTARGRRLVRLLVLGTATVVLAVGLVLAWVAIAATVAPGASAGDGRAGVASGAGAHEVARTVSVVVAPGDTLWQLAEEHAPGRDPRSVVADVVALNDLGSTGVQAGATLLVPVG